jgi:hypothetical protein
MTIRLTKTGSRFLFRFLFLFLWNDEELLVTISAGNSPNLIELGVSQLTVLIWG